MRILAAPLVAACVLALGGAPREAFADGVKVISGGPTGAERRATVQALHELRAGALAVCWVEATTVRVTLEVAAGGAVERARHGSGGKVGQCVAGVLAVQSLPSTQRGYRVVVDLPAASPRGRSAAAITEDLVAVRPALQQCYDRARTKKPGQVVLKFLIKADGSIVDARVQESTIDSAEAQRCMLSALGAARLRAARGAPTVAFSLSMALGAGAGSATAVAPGSAQPTPRKDGPIPTAVLTRVMNAARGDFEACARRARGTLAGTAIVRFTIGADGATRNVKIKSSDLGSKPVEACLVARASKLRFPAEKGRARTRVFYPFRFR